MISLRNYNKQIHRSYRCFIGKKVAQESRNQKIIYTRIHNENHYPSEFLDEYFSKNPIPIKNNNCLPITLEMIKELPIKMLFYPNDSENLTSDGINVFFNDKCIGFWL
jgi:hypothetical protein